MNPVSFCLLLFELCHKLFVDDTNYCVDCVMQEWRLPCLERLTHNPNTYSCVRYTLLVMDSWLYYILSHALKNTAKQRPGVPLHILRCTTGNMQPVVFHSTFPSLLARKSLPGSIWGLLESQLRNSSTPANHYEHFRSRPENFRRFPKIFQQF